MAEQSPWQFETSSRRLVSRDPFEAAFFTGEDDEDQVFARTDVLIRESIQNSMDAGLGHAPVRVRLALSSSAAALPAERATAYLDGLAPHLHALGNRTVTPRRTPPMEFLVIEDFGTRGLDGDPARTDDPALDHPAKEDFYWFWRNVGRSGKRGEDRGRWGLGKTVFQATSLINTVLGLTIRRDGRTLLMGQAVTRIHSLGNEKYHPEGFFCCPARSKDIQLPFEDPPTLARFRADFGLQRRNETGLSLVVPYPPERLSAKALLKSAISHYFLPILRGQLQVEVEGPDQPHVLVDVRTVRDVASALDWDSNARKRHHPRPPFDLAEWAIERQLQGMPHELYLAGQRTAPQWSESLFPEATLHALRELFAAGSRIAVRVPMTVETNTGKLLPTSFDAFLEHDADLAGGEDHFVRSGMKIPKIATLRVHRGLRGLVVVDDQVLTGMLGDAEGPAHETWSTGESRPDQNYRKWKWRVSFVKNALVHLVQHLTPPPEGLDEDLLQHIFSLDTPRGPRQSRKKQPEPADTGEPPEPPALPEPKGRGFAVRKTTGGFRIVREGEAPCPSVLRVRAAYDTASGSPFKAYSQFDFQFGGRGGLKPTCTGARLVSAEANHLLIELLDDHFEIQVDGFNPLNDLIVDVQPAGDGQA
ncbi:MAG: hypothetical protein IPM29_27320 [Planctomycetes bacterium]|nr:hypothetical protein [Planctomycetota bacterium]